MGRGWIAAVWCVRLAMVEFASSVVLTPAGVMKLVNIADLKSAASRLVGSSPIPGTRKYSTRFQKIPWTLDAAMLRGFFCFLEKPRSSVDLWGHLRGHVGVKNGVLEKKPPGGLHAPD